MNNIRQIIEERLENARNDYKYYQGGSSEFYEYSLFEISGQIEAYQDCLNLIPAPRTEADILNDFGTKLKQENEKLKKAIEIFKTFISVSKEVNFDTFITSYCDDDVFDLLKEVLDE